jgi:spore germination protein GerM
VLSPYDLQSPCFAEKNIIIDGNNKQQKPFNGYLYFIDRNGRYLKAIEQKFAPGQSPHDLGLSIIEGLIRGPSLKGFKRTLPKEVKINALFILDNGQAFIDFDKNIQIRGYSARSEMLIVYSIVNSLILNVEEINRVKILIQGETAQTLSGHINLDCFYEANMLIIQ